MMAGATKWIQWELSKIIDGKHTPHLIMVWPRPAPPTGKSKPEEIDEALKADMDARLDSVRQSFADSEWAAALSRLGSPDTLVAMRFRESGGLTVFRSERRNNDAYQIAVELLHLEGLDADGKMVEHNPLRS